LRKEFLVASFVAIAAGLGWYLWRPSPPTEFRGLDTEGCLRDDTCKYGNRVEDPGPSTEPWIPFESDDPFIWAADACLGYFMTRSEAALNGGITSFRDEDHWNVAWDARAKIHLFNWPFHEYGTFNCESSGWTLIPEDTSQEAELEKWAQFRLAANDGWVGVFDRAGQIDIMIAWAFRLGCLS
jgi:hypothetical protein